MQGIRPIDGHLVHRITSGQVVIDLQSAAKELVENSLDAGAVVLDPWPYDRQPQHHQRQNYGLKAIEVVDNECGIAPIMTRIAVNCFFCTYSLLSCPDLRPTSSEVK